MRIFVLISCIAIASARPEPGYSYNAPSHSSAGLISGGISSVQHVSSGLSSSSHNGFISGGHGNVGGGYESGIISSGHGHGLSGGISSGLGGGHLIGGGSGIGLGGSSGGISGINLIESGVGGGFAGGAGGFGGGAGGFGGATTTVHRHVYVHVPPPDAEEVRAPRVLAPAQRQRHYKIIFIKAPSPPNYQQPIIPSLPQNEEKTIIYVLAKKPDQPNDIVIPSQAPTPPSKPEVYFIKYNTRKEQGAGGIVAGGASGSGSSLGIIEGGDSGEGHLVSGGGISGGSSIGHSSGGHGHSHGTTIISEGGSGSGADIHGVVSSSELSSGSGSIHTTAPAGVPAQTYGPPGKSGPY